MFVTGESTLFSYSSSTETSSGCVFFFEDTGVLEISIFNGVLAYALNSVAELGSSGWRLSSIT